ncbi:farnesyl pyrophosphate synthase [Eurytemora carolleeae]|uniref:farnesyl pyrophosphate synthase n=1 Tax=Eurytemora carolleeae TaxID=1294199 RepID=UPI000C757549|nr:farnesyl pyrophosphate synthase [Eurytemora carolleeae]|eukprot:XP_023330189.1 farnesyl pyrophosphate synthase-like [Eurytemora affinis]
MKGGVYKGVRSLVSQIRSQPEILTPTIHSASQNAWYGGKAPSEQSMYSKHEKREFMAVFPDLNRDLSFSVIPEDLRPLLSKHLTKCIQYNVPDGKKNRGYSVPASFRLLASKQDLTSENIRLANILGWTVEFLQAFFLVSDDIMDHSDTRRGKKCWYKLDGIGMTAFNDSILLETCVYSILKKYFRHKPYYPELLELMHETTHKTAMGQDHDPERFIFVLQAIVTYKTSYYSFYLPVVLSMRMAGVTDESLYTMASRILLEMGHFFQVQDDYLDCFGDPEVTGKLGTDIQDGKCSWLITVAMQRAGSENKRELALKYGSSLPEDVAWVKNLYNELWIPKVYSKFEEEFHEDILDHIQKIHGETLPQAVFHRFLDRIYKRTK